MLARWQAEYTAGRLREQGIAAEIVFVTTSGDRFADRALAAIGGKELFTREIDEALAAGEIDLAVHSLKDVPAERPAALTLAAVPGREDPRDAWVSGAGGSWRTLPAGARVGTSSLRRQAQLWALRADLEIVPMRGNVDTRLRKWRERECAALVLAVAGLRRLGREAAIAEWLAPEVMCPAAGQGALALECRAADEETRGILAALDDPAAHQAVRAERALLRRLGAGCQTPVGSYAEWRPESGGGQRLHLRAVVGEARAAEGKAGRLLRAEAEGAARPASAGRSVEAGSGGRQRRAGSAGNFSELPEPEALGAAVAEQLLAQGAAELLAGLAAPGPEAP